MPNISAGKATVKKTSFPGFLAVVVSVLSLAACGGGGGNETASQSMASSTPPPTPVPPPVPTPPPTPEPTPPPPPPAPAPIPDPLPIPVPVPPPATSGTLGATPMTCEVPAGAGECLVTLSATVSNTGANVSVYASTGESYAISGSIPLLVKLGTVVYTLREGNNPLASVTVSVVCAPGLVETTAKLCVAPPPVAYWPPPSVTPISVQVVGTNRLPAGCLTYLDQCWRDSVANGTVKFIATPAVDSSGRPVMFAYFFNASPTANYSVTMFYADTGVPVGNDINFGFPQVVDWVVGTTKGIIQHVEDGTVGGVCYEKSWYPPALPPARNSNVWANELVACPTFP